MYLPVPTNVAGEFSKLFSCLQASEQALQPIHLARST